MRSNVARGALLGIAGQGWHLLTAFLLYAFLARQLGPAGFGQWRLVLSVLVWFEIFVNSGLVKVTTKAISEAPENRTLILRGAWAAQALVAGVIFIAVMILAGPISRLLSDPPLATLLRIAALDIPLYAAFMVVSSVTLGEQRFERQAVGWIIYATAKFVAIVTLVFVGFSVPGALIGNALSSLVGFAAVYVPWGRQKIAKAEVWDIARGLLVASTPFLSLALLEGLGQSTDLWMVSAIVANAVLVGYYAAASVLADVPTFLMQGLNRVLFPSVAKAGAEGEVELGHHYALQGVRLALLVTILAVGVIAATGRQALGLVYSTPYVAAYVPLVLLVIASVGRNVRATCSEVLMATNRRRSAMIVMGLAVGLEVVLVAVLASRFGLPGAAAGAATAALIAGLAAAILIRSSLGARLLLTVLRASVASLIVAGLLFYFEPHSSLLLLVVYAAAGAIYLLILRLLGEITSADVASVREAMGR